MSIDITCMYVLYTPPVLTEQGVVIIFRPHPHLVFNFWQQHCVERSYTSEELAQAHSCYLSTVSYTLHAQVEPCS